MGSKNAIPPEDHCSVKIGPKQEGSLDQTTILSRPPSTALNGVNMDHLSIDNCIGFCRSAKGVHVTIIATLVSSGC